MAPTNCGSYRSDYRSGLPSLKLLKLVTNEEAFDNTGLACLLSVEIKPSVVIKNPFKPPTTDSYKNLPNSTSCTLTLLLVYLTKKCLNLNQISLLPLPLPLRPPLPLLRPSPPPLLNPCPPTNSFPPPPPPLPLRPPHPLLRPSPPPLQNPRPLTNSFPPPPPPPSSATTPPSSPITTATPEPSPTNKLIPTASAPSPTTQEPTATVEITSAAPSPTNKPIPTAAAPSPTTQEPTASVSCLFLGDFGKAIQRITFPIENQETVSQFIGKIKALHPSILAIFSKNTIMVDGEMMANKSDVQIIHKRSMQYFKCNCGCGVASLENFIELNSEHGFAICTQATVQLKDPLQTRVEGRNLIADVFCSKCPNRLGYKYVYAGDSPKYMIDLQKLQLWTSPPKQQQDI